MQTCTLMIKKTVVILLCLFPIFGNAQLNGSGNVVSQRMDLKDFEAIVLTGMNGRTKIISKSSYDIEIKADDNLISLFETYVKSNTLYVIVKGNKGNKLYIEDNQIEVTISLPMLSNFSYEGNGRVDIVDIEGPAFTLKKSGNADVFVDGNTIEMLTVNNEGNGTIDIKTVVSDKVKVKKSGNGDVFFTTPNSWTAIASGNGDVINFGKGLATQNSRTSGNGDLITNYSNREISDLSLLAGQWKGDLTYLDFTSNNMETIPSDAAVEIEGDSLRLTFIFPFEQSHNEINILKLSADGQFFGGERIVKWHVSNKDLYIETIENSQDDTKDSRNLKIITADRHHFAIKKMVRYVGSTDYFFRNEFKWMRK